MRGGNVREGKSGKVPERVEVGGGENNDRAGTVVASSLASVMSETDGLKAHLVLG